MVKKKILNIFKFLFIALIIVFIIKCLFCIFDTLRHENELVKKYNISKRSIKISKNVDCYYDIRTEVESNLCFNVSCLSNRILGSFGKGCYYLYTVADSEEVIASIGMVDTYSHIPLGSGKMYKVYVKDKGKVPNEAKPEAVEYVELYDYSTKESVVLDLYAEQISYLIEEIISYDSQQFLKSRQSEKISIDKQLECRFFVKGIPGLYFRSHGALSIVYDKVRDEYYISSDVGVTNWYKEISSELQSTLKSQV